ncbi:MAG: metalloregulator ArsR/SmtB family transcription factor [Anaerolineae bacterium]
MMTTFEALAEPTRRRILDLLRERPHLVGELCEALDMSQPAVSKHLKVLRDVGLVEVTQDAQRRVYTLRLEPLQEIEAWLTPYRRLMEARYDRLEKLLDDLKTQDKENSTDEQV